MYASVNRREGRIAQRLPAKTWQFPSLFPERRIFVYIYYKLKEPRKIQKIPGVSSLFLALSNHTSFSQTKTGATVPLSGGSLPQ
jgi:hypothetical protein